MYIIEIEFKICLKNPTSLFLFGNRFDAEDLKMARGKRWMEQEINFLLEMTNQGMNPQEIFDSGKLQGRTVDAIRKQQKALGSIVQTKRGAIVQTILPAKDVLSLDDVVKRFTTAFKQICELKEVDKLALERFRIIFQAAKEYGPLLKFYENWEVMEQRVAKVEELLAELQARKAGPKT